MYTKQNLEPSFVQSIKNKKFHIALYYSQLNQTQAREIVDLLVAIPNLGLTNENFKFIPILCSEREEAQKDTNYNVAGIGAFTDIVEMNLIEKSAQFAVYSLKDLPTVFNEELIIGAIPPLKPRGDVVIFAEKHKGKELKDLPEGSVINTSSLRRIASLKSRFPHLKYDSTREKFSERQTKLENGQYDAIILAEAGVLRMGWTEKVGQHLKEEEYLYAPGQGALGVQCRKDDHETIQLLSLINQRESQIRVEAERQFLNKLEGGCKLPIAVHSEIQGQKLKLTGQIWSLEADKTIREVIEGDINDKEIGTKLSDKIKQAGANQIIEKIRQQKEKK